MVFKPKRPPYSGTKADVDRSRARIDGLLRNYGITQAQWTVDETMPKVRLVFILEEESGRKTAVQVDPGIFMARHRVWEPKLGHSTIVEAPNLAQTFRLTYYWLKAKLEATAYGLISVEREWLPETLVQVKGQPEPVTVGELVERGALKPMLTGPPEGT